MMNVLPIFTIGIWNAWLLVLPFCLVTFCMVGMKHDIAKRMSNMTGYTGGEKLFTISASLAPYPFMIATVWVPLTSVMVFLCLGLLVYICGMALFVFSLRAIIGTPPETPFTAGPYRFSRNPMYVAATAVFMSICLATANVVLSVYLIIAVGLQHFMVLAEERVCKEKYGLNCENYLNTVPRYLFF